MQLRRLRGSRDEISRCAIRHYLAAGRVESYTGDQYAFGIGQPHQLQKPRFTCRPGQRADDHIRAECIVAGEPLRILSTRQQRLPESDVPIREPYAVCTSLILGPRLQDRDTPADYIKLVRRFQPDTLPSLNRRAFKREVRAIYCLQCRHQVRLESVVSERHLVRIDEAHRLKVCVVTELQHLIWVCACSHIAPAPSAGDYCRKRANCNDRRCQQSETLQTDSVHV